MQKILSRFGDKILFQVQGKKKKKILRDSDCRPVLNFIPSLKYADLTFKYSDKFNIKSKDTHKIFFDLANAIEVQRNRPSEQSYINMLKKNGVQYRPSPNGNWFFPSLKLDEILKKLNKKGFILQLEEQPLRIKTRHEWQVHVEDRNIHIQGNISCKGRKADLTAIFKAFVNNRQYFPISDAHLYEHTVYGL